MMERTGATASVVIVTYNRPDYVRTCLDHLSRQTVRPLATIVVDSSPHRLTEVVVADFPGVMYLRNEKGRGTTATSRAIGVASVEGDIVALLDDDAFAEPEWLEELLKPYADPAVGAVGGRALNGRPNEVSEGVDQIGRFLDDGTLTGFFAADPGRDLDVDHLVGCNMSMRMSSLAAIGGIHDHYPGTCFREESDAILRLRKAGLRIVFAPKSVVFHVGGTYAKGHRFDLRYQYFGARNHMVLLTHVYGFGDPILRGHLGWLRRQVGSELKSSVSALTGRSNPNSRSKFRAVGGGLARAAVLIAGTSVGTIASALLAADPSHTSVAKDHVAG